MAMDCIFCATNHHGPAAGAPPHTAGASPDRYHGYFENECGEQAIFVYDRPARPGTLYLGDAGWDTPHRVRDGAATDLILTRQERAWLLDCWEAATGHDTGRSSR